MLTTSDIGLHISQIQVKIRCIRRFTRIDGGSYCITLIFGMKCFKMFLHLRRFVTVSMPFFVLQNVLGNHRQRCRSMYFSSFLFLPHSMFYCLINWRVFVLMYNTPTHLSVHTSCTSLF